MVYSFYLYSFIEREFAAKTSLYRDHGRVTGLPTAVSKVELLFNDVYYKDAFKLLRRELL